jgi:anti-sigma regulatory factor (Ser/Thr protein kinase)
MQHCLSAASRKGVPMYQHPKDVISITVMPNIRMLTVIQKATQVICEQCSLEMDKILKITLALEEVFGYCVKMVRQEKRPSRITITYRQENASLLIIIEHQGPQGLLEKHFLPGREESFKLTTFEAVGLKLAHDFADDLRYVLLHDGTNRFTITITLPAE